VRRGSLAELPPDLPVPLDDGAAAHLVGRILPALMPASTDGSNVDLSSLPGWVVVYAYPRTGRPNESPLVEDWDAIPGARGCTPQSCAFRGHDADLRALHAWVFGLSTQPTEYQREAVERLHLPFPLLSDPDLAYTDVLRLPTFAVAGQTLLKRLTLIARDGRIEKVFYPVFPPDKNADEVLTWLRQQH